MSYEYTNPKRASDPHALPDVEVFHVEKDYEFEYYYQGFTELGFYYAYGFPGCLWDSDPVGPFESYEEALSDARDSLDREEERP